MLILPSMHVGFAFLFKNKFMLICELKPIKYIIRFITKLGVCN